MNIQTTSLRIKEDTFVKIKEIAKRQERSINKQIEHIIKMYITDYEKINGQINIQEKEII